MSGRWAGGVANRTWQRPGRRVQGDPATAARLFDLLKNERFWCEVCNGTHRLTELEDCRRANLHDGAQVR